MADQHDEAPGTTLAWPDHDSGPTPPPESDEAHRDEPQTRKPLAFWDRVKFLVFFGVAWLVLVWNAMASNPLMPFVDAAREQVRASSWLLLLGCAELVRQGHYLLSENLAWYHRFWTERFFGGLNHSVGRLNDWNRFRLARAGKVVLLIAIVAVILGRVYGVPPVQGLFRLPSAIWASLPFIVQAMFLIFLAVIQFAAIFWFLSRGGTEVYFPEDIKTRFSDVWGQDAVLERVKENLLFLEKPEDIEAKGGYVPGGILLWGPPGTGKTLMAEAVAGETGKPYVFVDPGAFINMFFGVGILKVKALFRKLRKLAVRYGGVIVFFDEADALGNRGALAQGGWNGGRSTGWDALTACNGMSFLSPGGADLVMRSAMAPTTEGSPRPPLVSRIVFGGAGMGGGGMGTLQALLTELSGLKKPRGFINRVVRRVLGMRPKPPPKYRLLVIMATNMPQALDEALLRPGRIDRIYKVGYPSKDGRKKTFEGYLAKVRHSLTPEQVDKLATITPYATGATIKDMVNEALVVAIRDGREAITWPDVLNAKSMKEHGLPDEFEYVERERHAVAIHEACHAVVAHRLRKHMTIDIATIERRGDVGGFVSSIPGEDLFVAWKSEREADIMVSIASLVGERMFFDGDNSEGVGGDLRSATYLALRMEGMAGMGDTIASRVVNLSTLGGVQGSIEDGADRALFDSEFGKRVEAMLADLYARTEEILRENRREVLAVAHALETHKTVSGDDVAAILDGTEGPMLDGRPYSLPEFLTLAEEYHARALEAHKNHSTVDVPLPRHTGLVVAAANGRGNGAATAVVADEEDEGEDEAVGVAPYWTEESGLPSRARRRPDSGS